MKEKQYCPNCNAELKSMGFKPNPALDAVDTRRINFILNMDAKGYCHSCGGDLSNKSKRIMLERWDAAIDFVKNNIPQIPIITLQSPHLWDYEVIGMVTAQAVMGTGVMSEVSSSWSDFFGKPSSSYQRKIKDGEDICANQLRMKCLKLNANAIIATDIDYSEVGSTKNMLMICMSGTAIKVKNVDIIRREYKKILDQLIEENKNIGAYQQLDSSYN